MRILIVGGTSSIATSLKPALTAQHEVITAGRKNCDLHLDLSDAQENINLPDNIDVIIHTAAHFGGKSDHDIYQAEFTNVIGTLKLCQAAANKNIKHFIHISSMFATLDANSSFYNIYTLSKKQSEEVASYACAQHGMPLTILRPSQLYGIGEQFKVHQPFFYSIIDKARTWQDISFYGKHDAKRNYMHIDDLTSIITKVIQHKLEGVYNCTQMCDVTYSQIAKAAISAFNSTSKIHFLADKPDILDNIFIKDDSLFKAIDCYPQISIEDGIKDIAQHQIQSLCA